LDDQLLAVDAMVSLGEEARLGPEIINEVSKEFGVVTNNIFIGAPEEKHNFSIKDLGGVRVIL
jgi:hypothetical protein